MVSTATRPSTIMYQVPWAASDSRSAKNTSVPTMGPSIVPMPPMTTMKTRAAPRAPLLEGRDLGAEVLGEVLEAARIEKLEPLLRERGRGTQFRIAPGITVAVVREEPAHHLVGGDRAPQVEEHRDDVLEAPEE